jgi:hypothetical protein
MKGLLVMKKITLITSACYHKDEIDYIAKIKYSFTHRKTKPDYYDEPEFYEDHPYQIESISIAKDIIPEQPFVEASDELISELEDMENVKEAILYDIKDWYDLDHSKYEDAMEMSLYE